MAYCPECGNKLEDGSKFCTNCGARVKSAPAHVKPADLDDVVEPLEKPTKTTSKTTSSKKTTTTSSSSTKTGKTSSKKNVPPAKPKKKSKAWIGILALVLLAFIFIPKGNSSRSSSSSTGSSTSSSSSTVKTSTSTTQNSSSAESSKSTPVPQATPAPTPAPTPTPVSYIETTALSMIDELNRNSMAAKTTYKDQNISVTGRLSNVDSDGKYFTLSPDTDDYAYLFSSINCKIKTEEVRNQIMSINTNDVITVRGRVTDVGEILGYSMNVDDLGANFSGGSAQAVQSLGSTQPGSYVSVNVTDMLDELKSNALAAKAKYKDQYVSLTGKLGSIDSDGKYFALEPNTDSYDYLWESITCNMKTDEVKSHLMTLSTGNIITVRGKITDVGEVLGYYLTVDDFG